MVLKALLHRAYLSLTATRRCAQCSRPVLVVEERPSRLTVNEAGTLERTVTWCRVQPCGHTFILRGTEIIH